MVGMATASVLWSMSAQAVAAERVRKICTWRSAVKTEGRDEEARTWMIWRRGT
jgi:hypothetical protein